MSNENKKVFVKYSLLNDMKSNVQKLCLKFKKKMFKDKCLKV